MTIHIRVRPQYGSVGSMLGGTALGVGGLLGGVGVGTVAGLAAKNAEYALALKDQKAVGKMQLAYTKALYQEKMKTVQLSSALQYGAGAYGAMPYGGMPYGAMPYGAVRPAYYGAAYCGRNPFVGGVRGFLQRWL